ncbi:hypothetical protein B0T24DRAFT_683368 [Lasiosphaeria ovina]|uniref:Transmembrane protein n=1 Tax=Lasiosphaeria ovina TaxID=92902 RepID=A0AAE0JUS0_9PEZI|nr:hypothetical protein B0T24DRAFT_683368 [Lasiosphaeria ovina]
MENQSPFPLLTYIGMAMLPISLFFTLVNLLATRLWPERETTFHHTYQALAWLKRSTSKIDNTDEDDEAAKKRSLLDALLKRWRPWAPRNTQLWAMIFGDWLADGINRWLGEPSDWVTLVLIPPMLGAAPPYRFPDVIITTVLPGLNLSNFVGPGVEFFACVRLDVTLANILLLLVLYVLVLNDIIPR